MSAGTMTGRDPAAPPGRSATPSRILIVTGLRAEARIAAGPGCVVVAGGGDGEALAARLAELRGEDVSAILSFGIAGGLDPTVAVGDVVLSTEISGRTPPVEAPDLPVDRWAARLAADGIVVRHGPIVGVDVAAAGVAEKAALRRRTGAVAVDMESHVAAAYAADRALPFAALRIISDGSDRAIPPAAAAAMRPDGSVDVVGLLRALARDPRQIAGLVATARGAGVAFRRLRRVRRLLGPGFGLHLG